MILSPSFIAGDFLLFKDYLKTLAPYKNDIWIHLDCIDPSFASNMTFGKDTIESFLRYANNPLDIHIMSTYLDFWINHLKGLQVHSISFHNPQKKDCIFYQKAFKKIAKFIGIALGPKDSMDILKEYHKYFDYVVVMGVHPGHAGQSMLENTLDKINFIQKKFPNLSIQLDGGVTFDHLKSFNIKSVVMGKSFFQFENLNKSINLFKEKINI